MPPERVMLPILLIVAMAAAVGLAIPCAVMSSPHPEGAGWLPWAFVAMGVAGQAIAIFERKPAFDPKASAKVNAMVLLFGPIGARIGYALIGGAFLGAGIGLLLA